MKYERIRPTTATPDEIQVQNVCWRPSSEYWMGFIIGVLSATIGLLVLHILRRPCVAWYHDPKRRHWPHWLRWSQPQSRFVVDDEDIVSLTQRLASTPINRKWMVAFQYFAKLELRPQSPHQWTPLSVEVQRSTSIEGNTTAQTPSLGQQGSVMIDDNYNDNAIVQQSTSSREDFTQTPLLGQVDDNAVGRRYKQIMAKVLEKYREESRTFLATDNDCYRWFKVSTLYEANRRNVMARPVIDWRNESRLIQDRVKNDSNQAERGNSVDETSHKSAEMEKTAEMRRKSEEVEESAGMKSLDQCRFPSIQTFQSLDESIV